MMKDQRGSVLALVVLMLPLLIGLIGLTVDVGYIMYQKSQLDAATEAAGRSTILLSYDKTIWETERRVVIDQGRAKDEMTMMLEENFEAAKLETLKVINDNRIEVKTSVEVVFYFMRIFGFESKKIEVEQVFSGGTS